MSDSEQDISISFGNKVRKVGAIAILSTIISGVTTAFGGKVINAENTNQGVVLNERISILETKQAQSEKDMNRIYNKLDAIQATQIKILERIRE